jgi:hypothetical protein
MSFRVTNGSVREVFSVSLDTREIDGGSPLSYIPVTLVRRVPDAEVTLIELRWGDQQISLPPEDLLAVAEFVKSKLKW